MKKQTRLILLWPDAALRLHIGRSTAYKMAKEGTLPIEVIRLGGRQMVREQELEAFLAVPIRGTTDA